jgi:hypothetical protein
MQTMPLALPGAAGAALVALPARRPRAVSFAWVWAVFLALRGISPPQYLVFQRR